MKLIYIIIDGFWANELIYWFYRNFCDSIILE